MSLIEDQEYLVGQFEKIRELGVEERAQEVQNLLITYAESTELLYFIADQYEDEIIPLLEPFGANGELWAWVVKSSEPAFKRIPADFMKDKRFVLSLIRGQSSIYLWLPLELKEDHEVFLTFLENIDNNVLPLGEFNLVLPSSIAGNKELMLKAVAAYSGFSYSASEALRDDLDFCAKALDISLEAAAGLLAHWDKKEARRAIKRLGTLSYEEEVAELRAIIATGSPTGRL